MSDPAIALNILPSRTHATARHQSPDLEQDPASDRSLIYHDPTATDQMKFTTDSECTTHAIRSHPTTTLSDLERVLLRATVALCARIPSITTFLPEPTVTTNKKTAPSFMEGVMAGHTVTIAN